METKKYDVVIRLVGNQSPCHVGHRIGDAWNFDYMTPESTTSLKLPAS